MDNLDLIPIQAHLSKHEEYLRSLSERIDRMAPIYSELEMQRRALVAIKTQRDIDRNRRLMFMRRVKKQRDEARNMNLKLKFAVCASLLLSVIILVK